MADGNKSPSQGGYGEYATDGAHDRLFALQRMVRAGAPTRLGHDRDNGALRQRHLRGSAAQVVV